VSDIKTVAQAVYKYPLEYKDKQVIELPEGADILHVGDQLGTVCIWAKVSPDLPANRKFEVIIAGTGKDLPTDLTGYGFLGTAVQNQIRMTPQGLQQLSLVWHVWGKCL